METSEILQKLEPWRAEHKRSAWKPIVETGDGSPLESKFGGAPWLGAYNEVPKCATCGEPLQLFLQLNLASLPTTIGPKFGTGLLQLFYCINGECNGSGWEPFGNEQSLVRIVQPANPAEENGATMTGAFPEKRIVGWKEITDWPSPTEHEEIGLKYTYDFKAGTTRLECAELGLVFEDVRDDSLAENISNPEPGDKLGGWPYWIQGVEYPECPKCGSRMTLLFQLDSEDNLPFMFGDSGCGHITQCPEHKEVVAFGWACC